MSLSFPDTAIIIDKDMSKLNIGTTLPFALQRDVALYSLAGSLVFFHPLKECFHFLPVGFQVGDVV